MLSVLGDNCRIGWGFVADDGIATRPAVVPGEVRTDGSLKKTPKSVDSALCLFVAVLQSGQPTGDFFECGAGRPEITVESAGVGETAVAGRQRLLVKAVRFAAG
jgi:hypothetical protein